MAQLFSPFTLRGVTLPNRLVVSPMCQYSASDGLVNDWHMVHLGCRAVGGAGLVFTEAVAVSPEGRISAGDLGLWSDKQVPGMKQLATFIKNQQVVPGIQLAHSGRKGSTTPPWMGIKKTQHAEGGWETIAPSSIPYRNTEPVPAEMTPEEINTTVSSFAEASKRAIAAGFEVIEIHAAHGYLLHEFLSPLSNKRTDEFGSSFENRTRFLRTVVAEIRKVIPESTPLFVRISATDYATGGWMPDDSILLARILCTAGVDLIDCSTGGIIPGIHIETGPGYQVHFAEIIKQAGIPTGAVGLLTDAFQAEEILKLGKADLIFMAREMLRNPYFPRQAAQQLGVPMPWPVQYERAEFKKK